MRTKTKTNKSFAPRATGLGGAVMMPQALKKMRATVMRAATALLTVMLTATVQTARAQNTRASNIPEVTVTLLPGVGTGDPIIISSLDEGRYYGESISSNFVEDGQFFTYNGELYFMFPNCPDSFTAPDGYLFDKWDKGDPSQSYPSTQDMTLTAIYKEGKNSITLEKPTSVVLSPSAVRTQIPFTVSAEKSDRVERTGSRPTRLTTTSWRCSMPPR